MSRVASMWRIWLRWYIASGCEGTERSEPAPSRKLTATVRPATTVPAPAARATPLGSRGCAGRGTSARPTTAARATARRHQIRYVAVVQCRPSLAGHDPAHRHDRHAQRRRRAPQGHAAEPQQPADDSTRPGDHQHQDDEIQAGAQRPCVLERHRGSAYVERCASPKPCPSAARRLPVGCWSAWPAQNQDGRAVCTAFSSVGDFVVGQLQVERGDRLGQVVGLGGADDRCGHDRVASAPRPVRPGPS